VGLLPPAYPPPIEVPGLRADSARMSTAVVTVPRDVKSFRLAQPVATDFTVCTLLSLAVSGVWLLVLPVELLQVVST
jgi:hypothetical protein